MVNLGIDSGFHWDFITFETMQIVNFQAFRQFEWFSGANTSGTTWKCHHAEIDLAEWVCEASRGELRFFLNIFLFVVLS